MAKKVVKISLKKMTVSALPKKRRRSVRSVSKLQAKPLAPPTSYDEDFFQWTIDQASYLKNKEFSKLDLDHLIEEIQSLGRSESRALESHLANLFLHLLKIKYQPGKHTRSWDLSVRNAHYHAKKIYMKNPSLKKYLPEIFKDAYYSARLAAIDETGLEEEVFSETCMWSVEEIFP